MSREFSASVEAAISQRSTTPIYLISVGFVSGTIHRTTHGSNIDVTGRAIYEARGIEFSEKRAGGAKSTASLKLSDADNIIRNLVMNDQVATTPVKVWMLYEAPVDAVDPADLIAIFEGRIVAGSEQNNMAFTFQVEAVSSSIYRAPSIRIDAFVGLSGVAAKSDRITIWNGDILELQ